MTNLEISYNLFLSNLHTRNYDDLEHCLDRPTQQTLTRRSLGEENAACPRHMYVCVCVVVGVEVYTVPIYWTLELSTLEFDLN